jgi:hypothetical protein
MDFRQAKHRLHQRPQPALIHIAALRIEIAGGPTQVICETPYDVRGGTWSTDNYILLGSSIEGLFRVPASGGTPARLTNLDRASGETSHRWPQMLPGGRFLYFAGTEKPETTGIYATSIARPAERALIMTSASSAIYASAGYLLWARGRALMAQPFDAASLKLTGDAEAVADPVSFTVLIGGLRVSISNSGLLMYDSATVGTQLTWFDRAGKSLGRATDPDNSYQARLSPDGQHAAVVRPRE